MLKIKVCGMKYPDNVQELSALPVDFMGMIFYGKSARFVSDLDITAMAHTVKRVGVFVDSESEYVKQKIDSYKLDFVQLHGNESPEYCKQIKDELGIPIIKAFNVCESNDFEKTDEYRDVCNFFLFDTKTPLHGGSGLKFDWEILEAYKGDTPFFLSGGIGADDAKEIKKIAHSKLYALDLNSKFETEPGLKDIALLDRFIKELKQ